MLGTMNRYRTEGSGLGGHQPQNSEAELFDCINGYWTIQNLPSLDIDIVHFVLEVTKKIRNTNEDRDVVERRHKQSTGRGWRNSPTIQVCRDEHDAAWILGHTLFSTETLLLQPKMILAAYFCFRTHVLGVRGDRQAKERLKNKARFSRGRCKTILILLQHVL